MQQLTSLILEVRDAAGHLHRHRVENDGYLIGRGDFCDLRIDEAALPLVHSEIHIQEGAIWIEAVDAPAVEINGKAIPRLSLRSGDLLQIGTLSATVRSGEEAEATWQLSQESWEDLSHLSALELCERIEAEEAAIRDEERQHWHGVESLLVALEELLRDDQRIFADESRTDEIVQQLHQLSEALATRTQQLAEQELQFLNTASEIQHSQDDMARRMDELIHHLDAGELRASA
ncbi:MAG TPA: FHA domain-containing protein [Planctomycetaceae bacterium]|nr:FHA domain-containing protein [Planctomycetaceae bacterium]